MKKNIKSSSTSKSTETNANAIRSKATSSSRKKSTKVEEGDFVDSVTKGDASSKKRTTAKNSDAVAVDGVTKSSSMPKKQTARSVTRAQSVSSRKKVKSNSVDETTFTLTHEHTEESSQCRSKGNTARRTTSSRKRSRDKSNFRSESGANQSRYDLEALQNKIKETPISEAEVERRRSFQEAQGYCTPTSAELSYRGSLPKWPYGWILVKGARKHNLKYIDAPIPLSALTVVTGVSGSGKSTLVEDVLVRSLNLVLRHSAIPTNVCETVLGVERIHKVLCVDQTPIGQTPTSNAATYTGLFEQIRNLYSQLPESRTRGLSSRHFSFNVPGGRCEKCEGAGALKFEMHFLPDVWVTCDQCNGARYNQEVLKVKFRGKSIADTLATTCGEALTLFRDIPAMTRILQTLCDVGLDYLPLGQPSTTLSGGEAQRIKLATELSRIDSGRTFYVLDEPTTGLHFDDVKKLLLVLHRLVDLGNTVVVVEHNIDVIKNADWILDIGPEAGQDGGKLVFAGTPEQLVEYAVNREINQDASDAQPKSYTGLALYDALAAGHYAERVVLNAQEYRDSLRAQQKSIEEVVRNVSNEDSHEESPWEQDGRSWHMGRSTSNSGSKRRWNVKILATLIEKLEEVKLFDEIDWNNRTIVEARAQDQPTWFFRAFTNEEWLLRVRFRVPKGTFDKASLISQLDLKPLNEIDEVPLYGTQPRVKVEALGAWQEVELKFYSLKEIERSEFTKFFDEAVSSFSRQVESSESEVIKLTPWRTQGREWHFSEKGRYGDSNVANWTLDDLTTICQLVEELNSQLVIEWTGKIAAPFYLPESNFPMGQIFTKNNDAICLQLNVKKGAITLSDVSHIGYEPEIEESMPQYDSIFLRFRSSKDINIEDLRAFLSFAFERRSPGVK
ncbi:MAG: hypothetical protein Q4G03_09370 [Planctomycetia bacterium]|nr:hypothetical protein [Planctomycetia bacterium]